MKKITLKSMLLVGFTLVGVATNAQTLLDVEDGTYNKLTLNVMANGLGESNADFTIIANPNPSGINTSSKVVQFRRNTNLGDPWAGFWSPVMDPDPDFTTNKYVHVKVLKTKLSPVKFKIEGGVAGTIEIASMNAYTTAGVWQDMVFDFSSKTGTYPTVALMPDFEEPITKTGDIIIYFDDIIVNNISTPEVLGVQKNALSAKIQVYPNPTTDVLRIQSSEALSSATIYSFDGRKVLEINKFESGTTSINTSSLSKGAYLINFKAASGAKLTEQFIKE
jgi:hypothetical protein